MHFIFFDYTCKTGSVDVKLNDEAQSYIWVRLDDAVNQPLDSYTRTIVEKIIEQS
jgi:nucleoside triphosphatase